MNESVTVLSGTTTTTTKQSKKQANQAPKKMGLMKKLSPEGVKLLSSLRERANKKTFGRKVKESEIISVALELVTNEHLEALQEKTYSERDRLNIAHDQYQKAHGKISLDQFIGKLMRGELNSKLKLAQDSI